ncbi:polyketide synthase [Fusarium subglutinans]|uniref:Polyketide synthase n=1 Tax=Gibberella subglutinans TaxID=42677 RepID=A0A0U2RS09_GIBSU|nr:polyketide synthase [Fusarium subglutinans]ALQ33012.1 putative polyketide synthase [Fusarium subglutinans]KAF5603009.1 polyketide synthase [Fusarium subglutinans]
MEDCRAPEPIAIIGLSCKFAGEATNADKLWQMIANGRDAWSQIPMSRFNWAGSFHPDHEKSSTMHVRAGYFLKEDLGNFDAAFFSLSAETAASMDPQFRLQLESVYEALENAGQPIEKVAGSDTSVYMGTFNHDYRESMIRDEDDLPRFMITGTGAAMASNRVSHFFDLRGASMTLDTGCSTSLVALNQAVSDLRSGNSTMAIVGSSNLMLNPDMFKALGSIGVLSPDGKSFSFDSRANGYGRGEGVATVIIKRWRDAVAAGDPIRAVIRETCLNQDGRTETITSPSSNAQEQLIRKCYQSALLDPLETQYFEAHGTGTPTGDPIELQAVAAVFQPKRQSTCPLRVGSIKANIGHTEPVSGLASLIKVILALEKGEIPPSINFEKPNAKLDLEEWKFEVPQKLEPWIPNSNGIRRASINNFGYGGTNAHVIVEMGPPWLADPMTPTTNGTSHTNGYTYHMDSASQCGTKPTSDGNNTNPVRNKTKVLVLSARDERACQDMISNLKDYLERQKEHDLPDEFLQRLIYTLGQRRSMMPWVAACPISYTRGMSTVVESLGSSQFKPKRIVRTPRIGMVFTGQGAQWYAMGRELIIAYPVFRSSLELGDAYLRELGADWSLMEELMRDATGTKVFDTAVSIPICAALQISLVNLLQSWGVKPAAVTSHSSGEIAAAYAAGVIDYRASMAIAHYRSVLSADKALRGSVKGGMVAVGVGSDHAATYLEQLQSDGKASIACINSPKSVTIAGDLSAVLEVETRAKNDGVLASRLNVDIGYHSHQMEPISHRYGEALGRVKLLNPSHNFESIVYSSPVTGGRMTDPEEIASAEHWVASLVQPVKFLDAFTDMLLGDFDPSGTSVDVVVEVGPHSALRGPIRQILELPEFSGLRIPYYSCLVRKNDARDTMQTLAANLIGEGLDLQLDSLNFPYGRESFVKVLTDLPSYSWNHQTRHWVEPRFNRALRERDQEPHSLIGSLVLGAEPESPSWRHILRASQSPWLRDHVVQSNVLYPGAGFICLALAGITQMVSMQVIKSVDKLGNVRQVSGYRLRDVEILRALLVPDTQPLEVQTKLCPAHDREIGLRGWYHFEILSVTGENRWNLHAQGSIKVEFANESVPGVGGLKALSPLIPSTARRIAPDDVFATFRSVGIEHGPAFQNFKTILQCQTEPRSKATIIVADTSANNTIIHPTTLDSIVQAAYTALPKAGYFQESPRVPRRFRHIWISSNIGSNVGHEFEACSRVNDADSQSFEADVRVFDAQGNEQGSQTPVLEIQGLLLQSLGQAVGNGNKRPWEKEVCSRVEWDIDMTLAGPETLNRIQKELVHSGPGESFTKELRPICLYYIHEALAELSPSDVSTLTGHLAKFYRWMQDQVELASPQSESDNTDETIDLRSLSPGLRLGLISRAITNSVAGEMICRLGPHLANILRGKSAPLELMAQNNLLSRYYEESPGLKRCFSQLSQLLRKIVHKNPRARILEIGAGTGSATRHALEVLGSRDSGGPLAELYHYTDISMGFFETAREDLSGWSDILAFDKLDIEQDPAEQGFTPGSYDVVIACQVLHATKSISKTMANVRSLMKPGGSLLLIETTQDQIDIQFIFGLLPGWWLSQESTRQNSPSLSITSWDNALRTAGFTGVDMAVNESEDTSEYAFSTIMSHAKAAADTSAEIRLEDIVLVTTSKSVPPEDWIASLAHSIGGKDHCLDVQLLDALDVTGSTYRGKICVFLAEMDENMLFDLNSTSLEGLKLMVTNCYGLLWITVGGANECDNPCSALATGFVRSLRNEYVGRRIITLDLDPSHSTWSSTAHNAISRVLRHFFRETDDSNAFDGSATDFEFAERNETIMVPRYYKDTARNELVMPQQDHRPPVHAVTELFQQELPVRLHVGIPGLLDTLTFIHDDAVTTADESQMLETLVEIEVRAYGLNFRDVMVSMGQLEDKIMGIECAGVITKVGAVAALHGHFVGENVFALLRGPFASRVRTEHWNAVSMPEGTTFEEAASMPMVFTTAYVALYDVAHIQRGQSVLIHAAAGGVGQAAIQLAQHLGADIYVTVGSPKKKKLIQQKYGIPDHHIFNSRDASFASGIRDITGGRGVDLVLNSLAGPLLQESFGLVAPFGHFVEIGRRDLEQNSFLEMRPFIRHISFSSLDILQMTRGKGPDVRRILTEIARLKQRNVIAPVDPLTSYPISDITKAFRLMQTGQHTGKIVVSTDPLQKVQVHSYPQTIRLSPDASYLLVGGLGGIGRCLASWLVNIGAKQIILMSRSAGTKEDDAVFIRDLAETGCRIECISCDISKDHDLERAIQLCTAKGLAPIRGVIHAAMVLQDSILEQMTIESFRAAVLPKVHGSWNLHTKFQNVDFFIMLSSINGIVGYASQANYSAGGSYQDALAQWRVANGLPAVSLDLCAVKTVGYVAETAGVAARMQRAGHMLLREDQLIGLLESAILHPFARQIVSGLNTGPGSHWNRDGESQLGRDARFSALQYRQPREKRASDGERMEKHSLAASLAEVTSRADAEAIVFEAIAHKLSSIFVIAIGEIEPSKHPSHYGVDSLVAVELRNMISLQAAADVSIFSILQSQSLGALASEIVAKSRYTEIV